MLSMTLPLGVFHVAGGPHAHDRGARARAAHGAAMLFHTRVETAWFQHSEPACDALCSSFAFYMKLRR
jgi:hypothetical protein